MAAAAQSTPAPLSLEDYLRTSYEPDCEYIDGFLEERNLGGTTHGLIQIELGIWFCSHYQEWNLLAIAEQRTLVQARRVRIPDVAVVFDDETFLEEPGTRAAFIAIEILSAEDRLPRVIPRLKDFLKMGVENIWLLDPIDRVAYTYSPFGLNLVETTEIRIDNSPVFLDLAQFFRWLDPKEERKPESHV